LPLPGGKQNKRDGHHYTSDNDSDSNGEEDGRSRRATAAKHHQQQQWTRGSASAGATPARSPGFGGRGAGGYRSAQAHAHASGLPRSAHTPFRPSPPSQSRPTYHDPLGADIVPLPPDNESALTSPRMRALLDAYFNVLRVQDYRGCGSGSGSGTGAALTVSAHLDVGSSPSDDSVMLAAAALTQARTSDDDERPTTNNVHPPSAADATTIGSQERPTIPPYRGNDLALLQEVGALPQG
jgi:hypothetical protein